MSFSDNLRTIRKEKNISQEDLAELLNVSRQAVSKWEQDIGYPEMEKMVTLSKALGVSLDFLMFGQSENTNSQKQATFLTGTILIGTFDGKATVNCIKVCSKRVFPGNSSKWNVPQYVLFGIDSISLLGENRTLLGWYANAESIAKEQEEIAKAIKKGETSYKLKYAAKVIDKLLSIKLDDSEPAPPNDR